MSSSLIEVLMEGECRANRSCTIAALLVSAVVVIISVLALSGVHSFGQHWMWAGLLALDLPILAIVGYARTCGYRGQALKHLLTYSSALIPVYFAVLSDLGFFLLAMPIVVSGLYFSRRFVWQTYAMTVALAVLATVPHAWCTASTPLSGDGTERVLYWKSLVRWCVPVAVGSLACFAIFVSRICQGHFDLLRYQAKLHARLSDVEKGLAIAATMQVMAVPQPEGDDGPAAAVRQPEVGNWSTEAIAACIAKCRRRAQDDASFAALVERDPAAAVREVGA